MYEDVDVTSGISIHAPPRGATRQADQSVGSMPFQFTPLREGRRYRKVSKSRKDVDFNSRPSARGDRHPRTVYNRVFYFNSRPSARGDAIRGRLAAMALYFNSRPSARGDVKPGYIVRIGRISIHAPPRGATIPAHRLCTSHKNFNSRPSARGDNPHRGAAEERHISIHAPPRGATAKDMQFLQIFCSTLTNQHGLTIVPGNLSRLFW